MRGEEIWREKRRSGERRDDLVKGKKIWSDERRSDERIGDLVRELEIWREERTFGDGKEYMGREEIW